MWQRSYQPELLDAADIPTDELHLNLYELNIINTLLGGHAVTLKAMQRFRFDPNQTYTLLDIGCGGGDNLKALAKWARKKGYHFSFTGVDLKEDCIAYAQQQCKDFPEIHFICSDYRDLLHQDQQYDIIGSALFCHHFTEAQLQELIAFKRNKSKMGFFINDLHRHPFAYYSIKWLTYLFSKSRLVKNDAPLSVKRGFSKQEWIDLLKPKSHTRVSWVWAFRWLVTETHG